MGDSPNQPDNFMARDFVCVEEMWNEIIVQRRQRGDVLSLSPIQKLVCLPLAKQLLGVPTEF